MHNRVTANSYDIPKIISPWKSKWNQNFNVEYYKHEKKTEKNMEIYFSNIIEWERWPLDHLDFLDSF